MAPATDTEAPAGVRRGPPPAEVPGNLWTEIPAQAIGELSATASVSVIVGGEDPDGLVPVTLASLAAQSYPGSLTEVLVERPPEAAGQAPSEAGEEATVRFVDSPDEANGEILVLVEAGSVADPRLIEAHARWHHAVSDAVSVGFEHAIDAAGLTASEVAAAAKGDRLADLLGDRRREGETERALDAYLERTSQLTERDPDAFWVASCATIALRRETWESAGGLSAAPDTRLGRLDLAWRLATAGTVLVPERQAVSFLSYERAPAPPRPDSETYRDPGAETLIPTPGYRGRGSARRHRRPAMLVRLAAGEASAAKVLEALDEVLRGRFSDLAVELAVAPSHPERASIEEACEADPRVSILESPQGARTDAAVLARVPLEASPGERTLRDLHELMVSEGLGALDVPVPRRLSMLGPGGPSLRGARRPVLEVRASGPLARACRLAAHRGKPAEEVLAELFGRRSIPATEVGLRRRGASEPERKGKEPLPPATDLAHERAEHLRNRARAATNQARADRHAQRLVRERTRANHERSRAERLEARLGMVSPRYWARWRSRQVARRARAAPQHIGQAAAIPRRAALRARQLGSAALARRRS